MSNDSYGGLKIYNLTPHSMNFIDVRKTNEDRAGKRYLAKNATLREATLSFIPQGSLTLSVIEPPMEPKVIVNNIRFFESTNAGIFNNNIPTEWLNDADILIVSQKCANVINHLTIQGRIAPIHADKFYIPRGLVYRYPEATEPLKTVGCIGLQRVVPLWDICFYANELNRGVKVSLTSLCSACSSYCSWLPDQRLHYNTQCGSEAALQRINTYLVENSYNSYPLLANFPPPPQMPFSY